MSVRLLRLLNHNNNASSADGGGAGAGDRKVGYEIIFSYDIVKAVSYCQIR